MLSFFRPGPSQEGAISTYERKVKDKSKKYTILERDYGGGGGAASAGGGGKKGSAKGKAKAQAIPKSKLKPKVQDFVNLIADISMMEEQMTKLGYDVSLITQRSRCDFPRFETCSRRRCLNVDVDVDVHCYAIQRRSI